MAEGAVQDTSQEIKQRQPWQFKPGHKPAYTRQKGTPNRTTKMLKEALLIAANEAGGGGQDGLVNYLTQCALKYPTAFLPLLGRVLPLQIQDETGSRVEVAVVRHVIIDAESEEVISDGGHPEDSS